MVVGRRLSYSYWEGKIFRGYIARSGYMLNFQGISCFCFWGLPTTWTCLNTVHTLPFPRQISDWSLARRVDVGIDGLGTLVAANLGHLGQQVRKKQLMDIGRFLSWQVH